MDPAAADPSSIIQALPAHSPSSSALPPPPPPLVQALAVPAKDHPLAASRPPNKRRPPTPPSPRRTRSGRAPEWTPAETLALVAEVAAVDDGWSRSVSAFQKWAMVAENLAASDARDGRGRSKRAAAECRRRWEALAAEYGAVRRTGGAYWELTAAARRKAGLPAQFDAEVYGAMDALILVEEALLADSVGGAGVEVEGLVGGGGAGAVEVGQEYNGEAEIGEEDGVEKDDESADEEDEDIGNDEEEEMQADGPNGSEAHEEETNNKTENSPNIAWVLANKLHENAQHIHTILNEEGDGQHHASAYSTPPDAMTTTRQKADELIKSLGGLLGYLNQFTELIKETGFENVGMT